jgi:hypothetical protein
MSERKPLSDADVDALVRAHLTARARAVDGHAVLARVRARTAAPVRPGPVRRRWLWGVAAAAAVVLLAFLGGLSLTPGQASAETLVLQAKRQHTLPVDRCYLVEVRPEPGVLDRFPILGQPRETRLWTRGDRFRMHSLFPGRPGVWGRDDQGRVWLARPPREGLRYEPGEAPESLEVACEVLSMQTETLLADLLTDYDLRREPQTAQSTPGTHAVRATLKPGRPPRRVREVLLEIDAESKVLQRVVVSRVRGDQLLATVTFTLVETSPQSDASYRLEGHLDVNDPKVTVYTHDHLPALRRLLLARIFPGLAWQGGP